MRGEKDKDSKQHRYCLQTTPLFLFINEIHAQVTIGLGLVKISVKVSMIEHLVELGTVDLDPTPPLNHKAKLKCTQVTMRSQNRG